MVKCGSGEGDGIWGFLRQRLVVAVVSAVRVDEKVESPDNPKGEHVNDHEENVNSAEES